MTFNVEVESLQQVINVIAEFLLSLSGIILAVVAVVLLSGLARRRFRRLAERRGMHRSAPALFDNVVQTAMYVIIGFLVLAALGVNTRSLATFAGLVTAALALSVQDVLKNIFCGFYLLGERPFATGDRIRVGAENGSIERIDLRVTRIRNDRQELVLVPNSVFFSDISITRSTMRFSSLTMGLAGVQQPIEAAEDHVGATVGEAAPEGSSPAVRLLRVGPEGCDFEITVSRIEADDQQRIIAHLHAAYPDATLSILAR